MDKFKQKTYDAIEKAIEVKKSRVQIYLSWISDSVALAGADPIMSYFMFAPIIGGSCVSSMGQSIGQIYREAEEYFFDKYDVGICFGGNNDGSSCEIAYAEEPSEKNWIIYKNAIDECIKKFEKSELPAIELSYDLLKDIHGNHYEWTNLKLKGKKYLPSGFKMGVRDLIKRSS